MNKIMNLIGVEILGRVITSIDIVNGDFYTLAICNKLDNSFKVDTIYAKKFVEFFKYKNILHITGECLKPDVLLNRLNDAKLIKRFDIKLGEFVCVNENKRN